MAFSIVPEGGQGADLRASRVDVAPSLTRVHGHDRGTFIAATLNSGGNDGGFCTEPGEHLTMASADGPDDPLLPAGLDSHRYRCCGNGVATPVAEWIGHRLTRWVLAQRQEGAA